MELPVKQEGLMIRMDDFPTHVMNGVEYRCGRPLPYGANEVGNNGINFSVYSRDAGSCTLLLFHRGESEPYVRIPFPEEFRIGNVFSMIVYGLNYEDMEYAFSMDGRYDPEKGYLFDKENVLLDPYARLVAGREVWGAGSRKDEHFRGCVIPRDFDWEGDKPLEIPMKDLVIYEAHVRGFTQSPSSGVKRKGTFAGLLEKIPYLKDLGVNCIELLPIFEFDEMENKREYNGKRLYNYWGYSTVSFYAPKAGYAAAASVGLAAEELKNMIKRLHREGIEVILDVVFNHTAEGSEEGPCFSFKGLDNRTYYLLTPEGRYLNYSGCGNTMNCNNSVVRNFILDCLRYWVADYHVDGFRFDLASILSRDEDGEPMANPPLLETLANDPILGRSKLIAEAWDAAGLYQVGSFPSWGRWAEWNGRFRDCVRRFVKSDGDAGPELVQRLQGSPDLYGERGAEASVNFVTCHDGFTLYDLVSYNEKHNLENGEDNRDGANDNYSWNCGVEGETEDESIRSLRLRQVKNAVTLLLLSRGVPMLLSGDEFLNTQSGNNNVYCQDGPISWLNWEDLEKHKDVHQFFRKMIHFRKEHPVLRKSDFQTETNSSGYPELSFHGTRPWDIRLDEPFHCVSFLYSEPAKEFGTKKDCFIYCMVNAYWEEKEYQLPELPKKMKWEVVADTSDETGKSDGKKINGPVTLMPRSIMVLIGK